VEITGELALLCVASGLSDGNHEDVDTNLGAVVVLLLALFLSSFSLAVVTRNRMKRSK
jgi:hypothetical protein